MANLTTKKLFGVFSENMAKEQYVALAEAGYRVVPEGDIVRWQVGAGGWVVNEPLVEEIRTHPERKYAIKIGALELSRARGGPRCMTMPLLRDEVAW